MKPTLKPFDLERALAGDSVITRDGEPVTQLHLFDTNNSYPLMGVVRNELISWRKSGESSHLASSSNDLFMAPMYNDVYVVVWLEDGESMSSEFCLIGSAQTLVSNLAKSNIKAQIVTLSYENSICLSPSCTFSPSCRATSQHSLLKANHD